MVRNVFQMGKSLDDMLKKLKGDIGNTSIVTISYGRLRNLKSLQISPMA
jgi:hypothetical protein